MATLSIAIDDAGVEICDGDEKPSLELATWYQNDNWYHA
jgi:hypothetical protein